MVIKGSTVHSACKGTGIIELHEDGIFEICVECMGSGVEEVEFDLE